jgi:hypothetical protein
MPKYAIFLVTAEPSEPSKTKDEINEDPHLQKMVQEFLSWTEAEIKAERVKNGDFLLNSSEETNIRVDFHDLDKTSEAEPENNGAGPAVPLPNSSVSRGQQTCVSMRILGYLTAEFPTVDAVVLWARSCPLSYEGFSLEIRQLQDAEMSINGAVSQARDWAGEQIVFLRKQLLEQGRMRRDEDGTLWAKVEDTPEVAEIVAEAEKREAEKDQV